MNTRLSISRKGKGFEAINIVVANVPKELAVGDTFCLPLFGGKGGARVVGRHWKAEFLGELVFMCEVSDTLWAELMKTAKADANCHGSYTIQEQVWPT